MVGWTSFSSSFLFSSFFFLYLGTSLCSRALDVCVLNHLFLTRHLQATGNRSAAGGGDVAFLALRVLTWSACLPVLGIGEEQE